MAARARLGTHVRGLGAKIKSSIGDDAKESFKCSPELEALTQVDCVAHWPYGAAMPPPSPTDTHTDNGPVRASFFWIDHEFMVVCSNLKKLNPDSDLPKKAYLEIINASSTKQA